MSVRTKKRASFYFKKKTLVRYLSLFSHRSSLRFTRQLRFSSAEAADPEVLARKLRFSPSQRLVSRAVYAEEYQKSLRECMAGDTPGEVKRGGQKSVVRE